MNSEPVPAASRKFQLKRWQTHTLEPDSFAVDELIKKAKSSELDMDDELSKHDGRWDKAGKYSKLFGSQAERYKFLNKSLSLLTDKVRNNQLTSERYLHLRGRAFDAVSDLQAKVIVDDFISSLGGSANKTMIGTPETPATIGGDLRPFRTRRGDPLNPATLGGAPTSAMVRKAVVLVPGDFVHDSLHARYEVIEKLGEGGQGAVYKVKDMKLQGTVKAIKIQDPMQSCKADLKERFMREGCAGNKLQHPHLVRVDDAKDDEVRELVYLVMEFVDGGSLRDLINKNEKGMEVQVVLSLIQSILGGLKAMHEGGSIHKDIKPENILIEKRGILLFPKIADLGLAGIGDVTGAVGTFDYMAPEQHKGSAGITRCADLYALGKIFHELLTGHRPELGGEPLGILRPDAVRFESVYRKSIKESIKERYQHCDEFLGALKLANDGEMRLDTALGLKRSGDKKAFSELKALAGYGETNAMHELADCFFKGFGCPPSDESGMKWLEEGARNGHALAMKELVRRYSVGDGCQIDLDMAGIWNRKCAKLGISAVDAVSAKDRNFILATGRRKIYDPFSDSEVELTVALPEFDRFLLLRAERNDQNAMVDLAHQIYRWANEINGAAEQKQGLIYAGHWFERAAKVGNGEAMRMLGKMCLSFSDDGVNDGNESFEDMAENWFQNAAEAGDPEGMFEYSQMCMDDELNESECKEWMDKAASQNFVGALNWKGDRQLSGTKPYIMNELEACECFKRSAKQDSPEGMFGLGLCLRHGCGTVAKPREAFEWFTKAQKLGNKHACAELANCYADGVGVESNPSRAFELFKESALDADVYSMAKVGQFLQEGRGVEKSEAEAIPWLQRAAEAGHAEAMYLLAGCYERQSEPDDSGTELSADEWFIKAADAGYTQSCFKAGEISFNEENYDIAREYFENFINCHSDDTLCPQARYYLGYCFEMGLVDGDVDIKKAIELYNESAKYQNCFAAERLAYAYLSGNSHVVKDLETAERWASHAGKWKLPVGKHEELTDAILENGTILDPNLPDLEKKNKARMGGEGVAGFLVIIAIFLGTAWTLNHYKYFGYAYTSCAVAAVFLLLAIIILISEWVQEDTHEDTAAFCVFVFLSIIIAANEYATPRFMPLWVGWTIYLSAQLIGTILFIDAFDKKKPSYSGAIFGGMILISTSIVVYRYLH